MSVKTSGIGTGGLAAVLALSRIFSEAALLPGEYIGYGMQRFTAVVLSFMLAAAVWLPLYLVMQRAGEVSAPDLVCGCGRAVSGFTGTILSVYLLFCAAETGFRAHCYASGTAFDSAPSAYFYIFTGAALLFAVSRGLKPTVRAGFLAFAGFLLLLALIVLSLLPDIKMDRLYPSLIDDPRRLPAEVLDEFSRSSELLLPAVLCRGQGCKPAKCAGICLLMSCGGIMLMTFLYNTVFGHLVSLLDYPFYALSSVSDITLLHRINGIDVMIWVSAAIVRLALFTFAFRETVSVCFSAEKAAPVCGYVFGAAALLISDLFTAYPEMYDSLNNVCSSGIPLTAAAVMLAAASGTGLALKNKGKAAER